MASDQLDALLTDLRARLGAPYGDRLQSVLLYGSHARGEATDESDVDVLAVLSGEVRPAAEIFRTSELAYEVGVKYSELVSVIAMSEESFRTGASALARNVRSECQVL